MRQRRGSAVRAWLVAHDAVPLTVAIGVVTVAGAGYGWMSVPSVHGGPLPVWLLTPPLLALFAGLGAVSSIPSLIWSGPAARARLLWSLTVCLVAGGGGELIGISAGQSALGVSTALLTGVIFGASVAVGRLAPLVAAAPIIVLLVQVHAVRDLVPARLWALVPLPAELLVWGVWALCLLTYARYGDRDFPLSGVRRPAGSTSSSGPCP